MCKNPHSVGDLVESEVFKSRTNGESDIVFFVDESGSISKKDLMDALSRPGHYMTVDVQERGFGHPGIMFKVKAAKPHTRQTEEMFNSETFLLKEVELKKPGWRSRKIILQMNYFTTFSLNFPQNRGGKCHPSNYRSDERY